MYKNLPRYRSRVGSCQICKKHFHAGQPYLFFVSKKAPDLGSPVTADRRRPSSLTKLMASDSQGPTVSTAIGVNGVKWGESDSANAKQN